MKYVEAPGIIQAEGPSLFLAGGISGTQDWQTPFIETLDLLGDSWTLFNPRRKNFPMGDPEAGKLQIAWEQAALKFVDAVAFWFPPETLCPITLFELGAISQTSKTLMVGCHPDYQRKFDVEQQLSWYRPETRVVDHLDDLAMDIQTWLMQELQSK